MKYELYIDIYMVVNIAVNFISLLLVAKILGLEMKKIRLIVSSFIVAGVNLILLMFNLNLNLLMQVIIHQIIPLSILLLIAFKLPNKVIFLRSFITTYIIALLVAGVLQVFERYIPVLSIFLVVMIVTYYVILIGIGFLKLIFNETKNVLKLTLYVEDNKIELFALYDTGNSLRDPLTARPVCVVGADIGSEIMKYHENYIPRYIPFYTIGGRGEIPIVEIKGMYIHKENSKLYIENQLIGITKENLSQNDTYQMILNKECI